MSFHGKHEIGWVTPNVWTVVYINAHFVSAQSHSTILNERPRTQINVRWCDDCYNHKGAVLCCVKLALSFVSYMTYISERKGRMRFKNNQNDSTSKVAHSVYSGSKGNTSTSTVCQAIHHRSTYQHHGKMERHAVHAVLLSTICSFIPNTFLI